MTTFSQRQGLIEDLQKSLPKARKRLAPETHVRLLQLFFSLEFDYIPTPTLWLLNELRRSRFERGCAGQPHSTGIYSYQTPKTKVIRQYIEFCEYEFGIQTTEKAMEKLIPKLTQEHIDQIGEWSIALLYSRNGTPQKQFIEAEYNKRWGKKKSKKVEGIPKALKSRFTQPWTLGLQEPKQQPVFDVGQIRVQPEIPMEKLLPADKIKRAIKSNITLIRAELGFTGSLDSLHKRILTTSGNTPKDKFEETLRQLVMESEINKRLG